MHQANHRAPGSQVFMRHERVLGGRRRRRYFLFAGEAGGCLGGMQDFYGAYDRPVDAQRAAPTEADWAEIAVFRQGTLDVVSVGERRGCVWRWDDQSSGEATASCETRLEPPRAPAPDARGLTPTYPPTRR
jgi:hypothetical protein